MKSTSTPQKKYYVVMLRKKDKKSRKYFGLSGEGRKGTWLDSPDGATEYTYRQAASTMSDLMTWGSGSTIITMEEVKQ